MANIREFVTLGELGHNQSMNDSLKCASHQQSGVSHFSVIGEAVPSCSRSISKIYAISSILILNPSDVARLAATVANSVGVSQVYLRKSISMPIMKVSECASHALNKMSFFGRSPTQEKRSDLSSLASTEVSVDSATKINSFDSGQPCDDDSSRASSTGEDFYFPFDGDDDGRKDSTKSSMPQELVPPVIELNPQAPCGMPTIDTSQGNKDCEVSSWKKSPLSLEQRSIQVLMSQENNRTQNADDCSTANKSTEAGPETKGPVRKNASTCRPDQNRTLSKEDTKSFLKELDSVLYLPISPKQIKYRPKSKPEEKERDNKEWEVLGNRQRSRSLPYIPPQLKVPKKSSLKKTSSVADLGKLRIPADMKSSSSTLPMKRNVSFSNLLIREYDVALGDHPSCSFGPPISLSWKYKSERVVTLDEYETRRARWRSRRTPKQLLLSYNAREFLLKRRAGCTDEELSRAVKEVERVKMQRRMTDLLLPASRLGELIDNCVDHIHRMMGGHETEEGHGN